MPKIIIDPNQPPSALIKKIEELQAQLEQAQQENQRIQNAKLSVESQLGTATIQLIKLKDGMRAHLAEKINEEKTELLAQVIESTEAWEERDAELEGLRASVTSMTRVVNNAAVLKTQIQDIQNENVTLRQAWQGELNHRLHLEQELARLQQHSIPSRKREFDDSDRNDPNPKRPNFFNQTQPHDDRRTSSTSSTSAYRNT